jgi:hypothetical protein
MSFETVYIVNTHTNLMTFHGRQIAGSHSHYNNSIMEKITRKFLFIVVKMLFAAFRLSEDLGIYGRVILNGLFKTHMVGHVDLKSFTSSKLLQACK